MSAQFEREDQADGTWNTRYVGQKLNPMMFYDIIIGSTKLKVTGCAILNVALPAFVIEVPRGATAFNFEGPILTFYNDMGGLLGTTAPNYN